MQTIKPRKWIVLSLSFLLFLDSTNAQDDAYQPMLVNGATWDIGNVNGATTCGFNLPQSYRYEIGGDTLIDNKSYTYFYRYPLATGHNELCDPYWVDSNNKELFQGAFLREDTIQKKIYIYYNDYYYILNPFESKEYLLYDFSLEVGDTLKSEYQGNYILSSIDTYVLPNGRLNRTFFFKELGYGYSEQIGWIQGLFSSIRMNAIEDYKSIYCESNDEVLLSNGWFTHVSNVIEKTKVVTIELSRGQCTISAQQYNVHVEILGVDGRLVFQGRLSSNDTRTFSLKSGALFLLTARTVQQGKVYSEKLFIP